MIYGANGYTGQLIAREAVRLGLKPILAGRSRQKVAALAAQLGCKHAVFSLEDQTATVIALQDVAAVLNCAGPFSATAAAMMQACLALHIHYFDISGEVSVFELAHGLHAKAQRAGMVLCPGVGFDVVPTDCIAAVLKQALPTATALTLGFESNSKLSVGTTKTVIESLGAGGWVRRNGALVNIPHAERQRRIDFGAGEKNAVAVAWGDVSTAFFTTGIANIEFFVPMAESAARKLQRLNQVRWVVGSSVVQSMLKYRASRHAVKPIEKPDATTDTFVWGEAVTPEGKKLVARVRTANPYAVTVYASLEIVVDVLTTTKTPGFYTPSQLMGARFIETLPGATGIVVSG